MALVCDRCESRAAVEGISIALVKPCAFPSLGDITVAKSRRSDLCHPCRVALLKMVKEFAKGSEERSLDEEERKMEELAKREKERQVQNAYSDCYECGGQGGLHGRNCPMGPPFVTQPTR